MKVVAEALNGVMLIEPVVHGDARGFFVETWNAQSFAGIGIDTGFVQDNHSKSAKGVLRGLHYQFGPAQAKLVRVAAGRVFDVAVDMRRSSPSFGQWFGAELSADNHLMLFVPEGFAHGFVSLEEGSELLYKCSSLYSPATEHCLAWDDATVGIDWPLEGIAPQLSSKDREGKSLAEAATFA